MNKCKPKWSKNMSAYAQTHEKNIQLAIHEINKYLKNHVRPQVKQYLIHTSQDLANQSVKLSAHQRKCVI